MYEIDALLREDRFWQDTYNNFISKWSLSMEDMNELTRVFYFEKETILSDLYSGNFKWSVPIKERLNKYGTKKKRIVYKFPLRERFINGVLYRVLSEYFKLEISEVCFSYKKGASTITAVNYLREDKSIYSMQGVKLDISSYFNSVGERPLQRLVCRLFMGLEDTSVYRLVNELYSLHSVHDKSVVVDEYMGLIPGTAIASFFANYSLKELDDYMCRDTSIIYARYSDDIIMFSRTKEKQQILLDKVSSVLDKFELTINSRKFVYFEPETDIEFLGLVFNVDLIDIHRNTLDKMKGKFKHDISKARKQVEIDGKDWELMAKRIIHKYNHLIYKCYLEDKSKYGWGYYAFRYVTTDRSIRELDYYFKDQLRYLCTGKHNKENTNIVSNEKLTKLGYASVTMMYHLFHIDYDLYCNEVSLLK